MREQTLTGQRFVLDRMPSTNEELWWWVYATWGVQIPRTAVCPGHCAPFDAFADAYFARYPVAIWKASRGFGGKTMLLSILGMSELVGLGAFVTILGGSGAQSQRVHETMKEAWEFPGSPTYMLAKDPTKFDTYLINGGKARTLMASTKSVRGPHPQRMRLDEIDEMDLNVLQSAQGQPMRRHGIETQTVMSSTHQYPEGCVDGNTMVLTQRGEVAVKDVTTDDYAMTRQGWRRVSAVVFSGFKQTVNVTLSNGKTLVCTDDHRIATTDGWNIPRWLSVGEEVCGIDANLILVEQQMGPGNLPESESALTGLLPGLQPLTGLTQSSAPIIESGVFCGERMLVDAMGLHSVESSGSVSSQNVGLLCHGFEMLGVDTSTVDASGATSTTLGIMAGVVDLSVLGDGSNQASVGPQVSATVEDLPVNPPVPISLSAFPYPAPFLVDSCPASEPLTVVSISHANRVLQPVYDLQIEGVHEFVGNGVVVHNTMTTMIKIAKESGWPVYQWCFMESSHQPGGWLLPDEVERKRSEIPKHMWEAEYELQEPNFTGRAIDGDCVERMWDPELGVYSGDEGTYVEVHPPKNDADYVTGVDWAKERDFTVISTWDTTVEPWTLVAFERIGRKPWPLMINRLNKRWAKYGGKVVHDATGIGNVVNDFIEFPTGTRSTDLVPVTMAGRARSDLITNFVSAVEQGQFRCPRILWAFDEMRYATVDDLYSGSSKAHLPDSVSSAALAWSLRNTWKRMTGIPDLSMKRAKSPWTL